VGIELIPPRVGKKENTALLHTVARTKKQNLFSFDAVCLCARRWENSEDPVDEEGNPTDPTSDKCELPLKDRVKEGHCDGFL
jgi:hypothetical protein